MKPDAPGKLRHLSARIVLLFSSTCMAMLVVEIGLRILAPFPTGYHVWPSKMRAVLHPSPRILPGIQGDSRFLTNSQGIRADELSPQHTYRILVLGGSTTEGLYLDQEDAWPYLLQRKLNERQHKYKVWVGNAGKSSLSTRHHLVQLRYLMAQYPNLEAVILLAGVNDMLIRLAHGDRYDPGFAARPSAEEQLITEAFSRVPSTQRTTLPLYQRTAIWQLLRQVKWLLFPSPFSLDAAGQFYVKMREARRSAARIISTLPDMSPGLDEYSRNITRLARLGESRSIRMVFMSQPTMWRPGLPKELEDLLWMGRIGSFESGRPGDYYSSSALAEAMRMYNQRLLDLCSREKLECVDLTPGFPSDTSVFYDDVHFNKAGAQRAAEGLAVYLLDRPPFR